MSQGILVGYEISGNVHWESIHIFPESSSMFIFLNTSPLHTGLYNRIRSISRPSL